MAISDEFLMIVEGVKIGDRYPVIKKLGEGGMGSVYLCGYEFDKEMRVAVKFLECKGGKNRFKREIKVMQRATERMSRNQRSHIVRYLDHGEWRGRMYLVMEFVNGGSIEDKLEELKKFDEKTAAWVIIQCLRGLRQVGVTHRDLKPANVMISGGMVDVNDGNRNEWKGGVVRVGDFGLAKEEVGTSMLTASGTAMGTAMYMSPEQCRATKKCDMRSDIYSLGVMLYQMVSGRLPFDHESPYEVMAAHCKDEVVYPNGISKGMLGIMKRMLEKNMEKRYQSLMECERDLCEFCMIAVEGEERKSWWGRIFG